MPTRGLHEWITGYLIFFIHDQIYFHGPDHLSIDLLDRFYWPTCHYLFIMFLLQFRIINFQM